MSIRSGGGRPCVFCGLWPGNRAAAGGQEIRVFSYTLLRSAYARETRNRTRTRSFGAVTICDRCYEEYVRGATMTTRDDAAAV